MMNTDIMRQIVAEAEKGDGAMPTATQAAQLWEFDPATLRDFRTSANAIYTVYDHEARRFLRLTWAQDRPRDALEAEMDYLRYLAQHEFPAAQPLVSRNNQVVESVTNNYARFYAAVFTAAEGHYIASEALTDAQIITWGASLGRLHILSQNYHPPPNLRRPGWHDIFTTCFDWIPASDTTMIQYVQQVQDWCAALPMTSQDFGLIHWDFEPDNLAWVGTSPSVFDFDDAAYFWYAADIAFALDDVLEQPPHRARQVIRHFLQGYLSERSLSREWIQRVPLFVRVMRVLKTARLYHAYAGTHPDLDPPWLARLRHRHIDEIQEQGNFFSQPFLGDLTPEESEIWDPIIL